MKPRTRMRVLDVVALAAIAFFAGPKMFNRPPQPVLSEFAQAVDLTPLHTVAVQDAGRIKSFDSFARGIMRLVSGPRRINGQGAGFSYLDLMFRPDRYADADVIYVKKKPVRERIAGRLADDPAIDYERLARFVERGLISPRLLNETRVRGLLAELERDLIRTARPVNAIRTALAFSGPRTLLGVLRLVPPPDGTSADRWLTMDALFDNGAPQDAVHAGVSAAGIPGLDPAVRDRVVNGWSRLHSAWTAQDAGAVNTAVAELAGALAAVNPTLYPSRDKLQLESTYFRYKSFTWTWLVYLAAVVPLLMAVVYRWDRARHAGLVLLLLAFGLQTTGLGMRWYVSGRIPNSNMFEAIQASTWFGVIIAAVLELLARKTAMRNLFALGAAVAAMVAMMCGHFLPATLSSGIDNTMPILDDVWLYIHTNVIIASYCLIAMAAVTALLYLRHRIGGGDRAFAKVGGAGSLIMSDLPGGSFLKNSRGSTTGQVLDGATMVLMELSFVMLWTGLVMGAIWADHSWGRPWGWDPKEVFALNTFLVFLLLVHVRLKVRDKGLWTAILAVAGCGVMLFNWIVINFFITGLHSYA